MGLEGALVLKTIIISVVVSLVWHCLGHEWVRKSKVGVIKFKGVLGSFENRYHYSSIFGMVLFRAWMGDVVRGWCDWG